MKFSGEQVETFYRKDLNIVTMWHIIADFSGNNKALCIVKENGNLQIFLKRFFKETYKKHKFTRKTEMFCNFTEQKYFTV